MSKTKIGDLRHRVQLQKYTERQDSLHKTYRNWETIVTVFAEIKPVSGYVTFDTQQIEKAITHKIRIRYYQYISSENWVLMKGRRFRIRSVVNEDERSIFLILLCEEVFKSLDPFEVGIDATGDPLVEDLPVEDA